MTIRPYQPGDESAQVHIYNIAASGLPCFKPANVEEVARRYRTADPDPAAKWYAVEAGAVVGYAVLNPNGRISYPWCLPDYQALHEPLLERVLDEMRRAAIPKPGRPIAPTGSRCLVLPRPRVLAGSRDDQLRRRPGPIAPIARASGPGDPPDGTERPAPAREPGPRDLRRRRPRGTRGVLLEQPVLRHVEPLRPEIGDGRSDPAGGGPAHRHRGYADPTKIDAAMPCFRLGAMGTEHERHKRVNGLFSCVFAEESAGEILLAEAVRRLKQAGLAHLAAQAPSDQPALIAFYDRYLHRQGLFPILSRPIAP